MNTKTNTGTVQVTFTYICWGLLTLFWSLLSAVNSLYVLAQRVIWSMAFMGIYLLVKGRMADVRAILKNRKILLHSFICGILICINWGVYIYAINSGHVMDASLGYFLEPIFVTLIGVLIFKEKMSRLEQLTALFSFVGVAYLIWNYRMVPAMALIIGLSFAIYGGVKKASPLDAELSLFAETLAVTPFALIYCLYGERSGAGSLGVLHGAEFLLFPMAGIVTSIPLLLFNMGIRQIPYYLTGILMYVNPTIQFLMGLFYFHEPLEIPRLITFLFIWTGVSFTIAQNIREMRKKPEAHPAKMRSRTVGR